MTEAGGVGELPSYHLIKGKIISAYHSLAVWLVGGLEEEAQDTSRLNLLPRLSSSVALQLNHLDLSLLK